MTSQFEFEGGGTSSAASTELIKWLRGNKLENQQLIELLANEEIESVDDLMVFKNSLGDEKKFTEILVNKGVKIGKISKLLKALNNYNPIGTSEQKNDDIKNQSLGSVIMLDTKEKEAIRLLSSKLLEIEAKLKALPQYTNKLSASKDSLKQTINNVCDDWVKLIHCHKQALFKWVEGIEQGEVESNKLLKKQLNDELHLVEETKLKCQGLMSYASIDDIWTPRQTNPNEQQPQENIVSLITNCVDKLDKSSKMPKENVFDQVKFMQFNKAKSQGLLGQNINLLLPSSTLSVDVSNQTQAIKFTLETPKEFDLYSLRELFVKGVESGAQTTVDEEDEKKDYMDCITKLSIIDNQCSISFQELDNKLGRYLNYVAYIVEHLGDVNIAIKREDIPFKRQRMQTEVKYALQMSSKYDGPPNTRAALLNDNLNQGCGTQSLANSWIEVSFSKCTIVSIEIAGPGDQMAGGWKVSHLNGLVLQYKDDKGGWIDIMTIQKLKQNVIESIKLDVITTAMRVFNKNGYVAIGCWKVVGYDYKYIA